VQRSVALAVSRNTSAIFSSTRGSWTSLSPSWTRSMTLTCRLTEVCPWSIHRRRGRIIISEVTISNRRRWLKFCLTLGRECSILVVLTSQTYALSSTYSAPFAGNSTKKYWKSWSTPGPLAVASPTSPNASTRKTSPPR